MKSTVFGLVGIALVATVAFTSLARSNTPSSPAPSGHVMMQGMTMKHKAIDQGHEMLQPAYLNGHLVQFMLLGPAKDAPKAKTRTIFEVEYPNNWNETLARPLCDYCDHFGDGENAWDYHDHILESAPSQADNTSKAVYWSVLHIQPAYSKEGNTAKDAAISKAYAALLPVQSSGAAKKLIDAKLPDGTPLARAIDVKYTFNAVLTRQ
jgi:hypothetical protein